MEAERAIDKYNSRFQDCLDEPLGMRERTLDGRGRQNIPGWVEQKNPIKEALDDAQAPK